MLLRECRGILSVSIQVVDSPGIAPVIPVEVAAKVRGARGLGVALVWFLVMRGAVYFQQRWREQVIKLDAELDRFKCYVEIESLAQKRPYKSVIRHSVSTRNIRRGLVYNFGRANN